MMDLNKDGLIDFRYQNPLQQLGDLEINNLNNKKGRYFFSFFFISIRKFIKFSKKKGKNGWEVTIGEGIHKKNYSFRKKKLAKGSTQWHQGEPRATNG